MLTRVGHPILVLSCLALLVTALLWWPQADSLGTPAALPNSTQQLVFTPLAVTVDEGVRQVTPRDAASPSRAACVLLRLQNHDGQPVAQIRAALFAGDKLHAQASSNQHGDLSFADLAPGSYRLQCDPLSLPDRLFLPAQGMPAFELQVGQQQELQVSLVPGAKLQGRVLDLEGQAVAGALVSLFLTEPVKRELQPVRTDKEGGFVFRGLPPGTHRLAAVHHPAGGSCSLPRQVLLRSAELNRCDLNMHLSAAELRGQVLDQWQKGVPNVRLRALLQGLPVGQTRTQADGSFAFQDLPAALLELQVHPLEFAHRSAVPRRVREPFAPVQVQTQNGQPVDQGLLSLVRNQWFTLRGKVLDQGKPCAESLVEIHPLPQVGKVGKIAVRKVPVGKDGSFTYYSEAIGETFIVRVSHSSDQDRQVERQELGQPDVLVERTYILP